MYFSESVVIDWKNNTTFMPLNDHIFAVSGFSMIPRVHAVLKDFKTVCFIPDQ